MVSVEKWKEHFKKLAQRSLPHEDMYLVSQIGRGVGKRSLYQIRPPAGGSSGKPTIELVSPVSSSLERARAIVQSKSIKKKTKKKSASSKVGTQTATTSKPKKKKKKATGEAKKKKKPKAKTDKKKKPKTKKKKKKDVKK